MSMSAAEPSVDLIWLHLGKNHPERLEQIRQFDYRNYKTVEIHPGPVDASSPDQDRNADLCLFWADDDKPVGANFLREMVRPICEAHPDPVIHYWEGNALCLPRTLLGEKKAPFTSRQMDLMRLLAPALESGRGNPDKRVRIIFSSSEKLAPLSMEPMGCVS